MSAPRVLVAGAVLAQGFGGVRRHNQELLPRVARLLAAEGGGLAVLAGRDGIAFELPPPIELLTSDVPSGPPLARALRESAALRRAIDAARAAGRPFDLVHTAHLPAPRGLPLPYTLTLHDLRALSLEHTPFSRRFVAKSVIGAAVRGARAVVCVSETVAGLVRDAFRPRALFVVPNAGDHFTPLPRTPAASAPLVAIGHLEPRKNLALLLHALALDPGLPDLELAGTAKEGEEERLRALAAELGLTSRVRFLGPLPEPELPRLLARAAAVVIPSRLEGFGIGVLEAQLAHTPLAVSNVGALSEVAGPDVPTFPPDDPGACARAIRAALEHSLELLASHAVRARRFTWNHSAQLQLEAFLTATRE